MVVAVNLTGFVGKSNHDQGVNFFADLARQQSAHIFIFITDLPLLPHAIWPENITIVQSRPVARHSLFRKHWYNRTLPAIIKRTGAEVLIHASGMFVARCAIQQIVVANNYFTPEVLLTADKNMEAYFRKNIAAIMDQASVIVVRFDVELTVLAKRYPTAISKIKLVPATIDEQYAPTDFFNKEATKEKYTEGKEYFLFSGVVAGNEKELIILLKAFSFLKKRQKTNMQLVLLPRGDAGVSDFAEKLRSYKYRDDVRLLDKLSEQEVINVFAAAYAFVHPLQKTADPSPVLQAVQSGVPVLATNNALVKELAGAAGLYVDATDFMDLANGLMLVFKDESVREKLEQQALAIAEQRKSLLPYEAFWQLVKPGN